MRSVELLAVTIPPQSIRITALTEQNYTETFYLNVPAALIVKQDVLMISNMKYTRKIQVQLEIPVEGPDCTEIMERYHRKIGKHGLSTNTVGCNGCGGGDYSFGQPKFYEDCKTVREIEDALDEQLDNVFKGIQEAFEPFGIGCVRGAHKVSTYYPQPD